MLRIQNPPKYVCIECSNKGRHNIKINKVLCSICNKLDKYLLISKTRAKELYLLKDNMLSSLIPIHANSSYGEATYYTKQDLINLACNIHETIDDNLENVIQEKIKINKNIKDEKNKIKNQKKIKRNKIKVKKK